MIQRPGRTHRCAPTNWFELFIIRLKMVVGANPCVRPLNRRLFPVRLSIGNMTFDSTPKDSRKGCPYYLFEMFIIHLYIVVGATVAGRQPFCRFATFPLSGEFPCGLPCTDVYSRPIVDRKHDV